MATERGLLDWFRDHWRSYRNRHVRLQQYVGQMPYRYHRYLIQVNPTPAFTWREVQDMNNEAGSMEETIEIIGYENIVSNIQSRLHNYITEFNHHPDRVILGPEEALKLRAYRGMRTTYVAAEDIDPSSRHMVLGMEIVYSTKPGINFELREEDIPRMYALLRDRRQARQG